LLTVAQQIANSARPSRLHSTVKREKSLNAVDLPVKP